MNSQWDQWVVGYNTDKQRQFFSQFGIPSVDWQTLGVWLMFATFGIGCGNLARPAHARSSAAPEPSLAAWNRFCAQARRRRDSQRAPSEGPHRLPRARAKSERPAMRRLGRGHHAALRRGALRQRRHARGAARARAPGERVPSRVNAIAPQRTLPLRQRPALQGLSREAGRARRSTDALLQRALGAHQQGRIDEAERGYREILERDASNAVGNALPGACRVAAR